MELNGFRLEETNGVVRVTLQSQATGLVDIFRYETDTNFLRSIQAAISEFLQIPPQTEISEGLQEVPALEAGTPVVKRRYRPIGDAGRIAIVFFPIVEPGGINTYVVNLRRAWEKLGHTVDVFYATEKGRMRLISETRHTLVGKWVRLPAKQLAYGTLETARRAQKTLNSYDMVLFAHQCPHGTQKKYANPIWKELYNLKRPVLTVFHDDMWDKLIPEFADVASLVDLCLCTNTKIKSNSGKRFEGKFVYTPHPLDISHAGLYRSSKRERIVWLPQWKVWKGIDKFAEACQWLDYETWLFNTGIRYYQLRRDAKWWRKAFGADEWDARDKVRGNPQVTIKGPILPNKVAVHLQEANVSVDILGLNGRHAQGQHSFVQVESMLYGATAFVYETTVQDPSPIPADCAYSIGNADPVEIARELNNLMMDRPTQIKIAKNALDFVTEKYDAMKVASAILNRVNRL